MKDFPPLLIVSGSEGFLRRRLVLDLETEARQASYTVERVQGDDPAGLSTILDGNVFVDDPTFAVVEAPHKGDIATYQDHIDDKDNTIILVLHYDGDPKGNTKFGKFTKKHKKLHKAFPKPKSWDDDGIAVTFCVDEAKRQGKVIGKRTAQALVSVMGADLGVLYYEILKASTLAEAKGAETIEVADLKGSMAALTEAEVFPAIRALGERKVNRAIRLLERVKTTSKDEPTIKVCRIMAKSLYRWLEAASLAERGFDPKAASDRLGVSEWFYKNKVVPPALTWRREGVSELLRAIAAAERGVRSGHLDPWTGFISRLVRAAKSPLP